MRISLDAEKAFDKIQELHDKGLGDIRDTRDIPKHNKGNIQRANSQYQIKWRKTESNSTTFRNKIMLSTLYMPIQYST